MKLVGPRPRVLADDDMRRIYEAAIRVARQVPLTCHGTDEFRGYLRDFGCDVEGSRVTFPAAVVDEVVARIEAQRDRNLAAQGESEAQRDRNLAAQGESRADRQEAVAGVDYGGQAMGPADDVPADLSYNASGQGFYSCDVATDRVRLATRQDLADLSRVVDAIPGLGRAHPTFIPQDVPRATAELHAFGTIALHSRQPHRVSVYSETLIERFFDIEVIARGGDAEAVRRQPTFACRLWFNTPFMITEENVRIAMMARRLFGQPLQIGLMPVAGSATPATLAGCVVHQTAETIVCNAITLAVDGELTG